VLLAATGAAFVEWLTWRYGARPGVEHALGLPGCRAGIVLHESRGSDPPPPEGQRHRSGRVSWLPGVRRRRSPDSERPGEDSPDAREEDHGTRVEGNAARERVPPDEGGRVRADDRNEPGRQEGGGQVVSLTARRSAQPREWNLWELESLARGQANVDPLRAEEWRYLFVHLRQFAGADGTLPAEFDGLVREAFGDLLRALDPA
jgi:hypothetical protein